ncbi:unnamed protein product, partial [Mesorhabditis spiculigera]
MIIRLILFHASFHPLIYAQMPHNGPPPPQNNKPDCSQPWQSRELTYVPALSQCSNYEDGSGITCSEKNPFTCTGRNPFCASVGNKEFRCCSDMIQDSTEQLNLKPEEIKPICPNGAIPYRMPYAMLCDPAIVNICPPNYKCVEAANGHLLPHDGRSLCCKTSTLYSFASVFAEAQLTPRIVPAPPVAAIEHVTLNVHTSALMHAPEIRTGDHFVLAPFKLLEPAYIKNIKLFSELPIGSYMHVVMFDPVSVTETLQFYYDRPSRGGKVLDLEEPVDDGGFISKKIYNAHPVTNMDEQQKRPANQYRKMWVVLMFRTVNPITRLYVSVTVDLHAKYRSVSEFLRSDTGRLLGTPTAGTYFYITNV